jgi:rhamnosyltransferase
MDESKVAVLLAAYNGSAWINEQVETILNQTRVKVEIFTSVDLSSDNSLGLVNAIKINNSNMHVLPYGEAYGGAAKNFFRLLRDVDLQSFDLIAFSDQDDIWYPDKLFRAQHVLEERKAAGYSSNVRAFWPDGKKSLIIKSQEKKQWDFLFEAAGPGCTYVMRKDLALSLQNLIRTRWDEVQSIGLHDWLTYAFARSNGYKWEIDNWVSMDYRQHATNQVGVNEGWKAFKYRALKVVGGWGTHQAGLIASVLDLDDTLFVSRWKSRGRLGLFWLALNANKCRRKKTDRVFFALSCIVLAIAGRINKS